MEDPIPLTIKAKGKNKSGLRVEQRDDGHYYVSKVPRGFKGCSVGDRVLEINGVSFPRFKNEAKANELIDTFQLQIIPIDNDDGMETTDDDFDFGSDLEERAASVPSAGLTRPKQARGNNNQNPRQNGAGPTPKKGPGRRENVEYIDETDSEQEQVPKGSKNRAAGTNNMAQKKDPPPKGPGRRESVEYLDDDEDEDEERGDYNRPQVQQRAFPSKPGPGRREVVEHLDDDDDTEDAADVGARNGVGRQQQQKKQPQSAGGRRRETVEYVDDDDTEDDIDEEEADDDSDDDEEYEEVNRQQSSDKPRNVPGRRPAPEDADDDTDDDEEYQEVAGKPRNVAERQPADDDEISEYDGDEESHRMNDDGDDEDDEDDDDDDDDDDDYDAPPKPLSASSQRHSMARKQDSRRSLYRPPPDAFEREYTSDYQPMDRWMVTVHKQPEEDAGISIVQYKTELFVTGVDQGPFFKTAIDKGDKVLSINGKKVGKQISSVTEAEELMEGKTQLTIFVLRPDTERDLGYKWVMENC